MLGPWLGAQMAVSSDSCVGYSLGRELGPMSANQENVPPASDPVANVRNAARDALASHIDGSILKSQKRRSRDQKSDAEKIESLFGYMDSLGVLLSLVSDVKQYLSLVDGSSSSFELAFEALDYVTLSGKDLVARMRSTVNYTKSKSMAASAHNKLTKVERQRFNDSLIQRRALAPTNPRRMLQLAMSTAKKNLNRTKPAAVAIEDDDVVAPRVKRRHLSQNELEVFTSQEQRQIILNDIRLPRPRGGNLVYSGAEAVSAVNTLVKQNATANNGQPLHPKRLFLVLVKEKMIQDRRIPVQKDRLNKILQAAKDGVPPPVVWSNRGRPDIMTIEYLRKEFDEHSKRSGKSWDVTDTRNTLTNVLKAKKKQRASIRQW